MVRGDGRWGQNESWVGLGCRNDTATEVRANGGILVVTVTCFFLSQAKLTPTEINETHVGMGLSWKP